MWCTSFLFFFFNFLPLSVGWNFQSSIDSSGHLLIGLAAYVKIKSNLLHLQTQYKLSFVLTSVFIFGRERVGGLYIFGKFTAFLLLIYFCTLNSWLG